MNIQNRVAARKNRTTFDFKPSLTINPRYGKKSYFFGGEFSLPETNNNSGKSKLENLVIACCETAVHCDVKDTYWFPVYKHTTNKDFYSTSSFMKRANSSRIGVIVIKKSDAPNMSSSQVTRMIERELSDYSEWVNSPMM